MDVTSNVIQLTGDADLEVVKRTRSFRDAIGKALGKAYPSHPWFVQMSDDGSVAQVTCPAITNEFGMVIHCNTTILDAEQKAVRFGGELLERFNVSRTFAKFDDVIVDARGNSIHGKQGGV